MRILITGACGFVGRRFVNRFLQNKNNQVVGVDDLSAGQHPDEWMFKPKHPNFSFLPTHIQRYFPLSIASSFDLIIHCAAVVGGQLKIDGDPLAVATDLSIDAEFFNWLVRSKPSPKVVYFSSSAAYPIELQTEKCHCALSEALLDFNVSRIGMPDMTYGWSKLCGEYLAKFAVERYGADVHIYRPFGGYGEDQDFTYPFPSIIRRILRGEDPVVIWGSGDQRRDFIYIEDIIDGVLATLDLPSGTTLNLGTGIGTSFYELADLARSVLSKDFSIKHDKTKPEGVFSRVADTYNLERYYKPPTTLQQGILKVARAMEKAHALEQA